jgi:arginyl-tRNA synthetase
VTVSHGTFAHRLMADAATLHPRDLGGYTLAYGSHAAGTAHRASDLDLLFVSQHSVLGDRMSALIGAVKGLHQRHRLVLDEEVSFEVKLNATCEDIRAALALGPFMETGRCMVPRLQATPEFLNSRQFKLRLTFNALTSPHVFLDGDLDLYRCHQVQADRAFALLALGLGAAPWAMRPLFVGPGGERGKDYLGYSDRSDLAARLNRGIVELRRWGADGLPPSLRRQAERLAAQV